MDPFSGSFPPNRYRWQPLRTAQPKPRAPEYSLGTGGRGCHRWYTGSKACHDIFPSWSLLMTYIHSSATPRLLQREYKKLPTKRRYHLLQTSRSLRCSTRVTWISQAIARSSGSPGSRGDWLRLLSPCADFVSSWVNGWLMSGWRQNFVPGTLFFAPATVFRPVSTLHKHAVVSTCTNTFETENLFIYTFN